MTFLHELPDIKNLFEVLAAEKKILNIIIEKDYWLIHCLWGLQQQGYRFELKGGTSLSKGFNIIERFSEDINIQIHPDTSLNVKTGKNQDKPAHIKSRECFFNLVAEELHVPALQFSRDDSFDDTHKMRSAGIRAEYDSFFTTISALKPGIVLELGFDQTTPNIPCTISSWALDKALSLNLNIIDNSAKEVKCYCPEYTFVEKLQTISTKFRLQQQNQTMPINFLRLYYDIHKLLNNQRVLSFIGTEAYYKHKRKRFRSSDEYNLTKNAAFSIPNKNTRKLYNQEFEKKSAIYFGERSSLEKILDQINEHIDKL